MTLVQLHAQENLIMRYDSPALNWGEALPVGCSNMGAMIYGGTDTEELQLNEATLWGGGPYNNVNPNALEKLSEIRELILIKKSWFSKQKMRRVH